jgi:hypothetical protein
LNKNANGQLLSPGGAVKGDLYFIKNIFDSGFLMPEYIFLMWENWFTKLFSYFQHSSGLSVG